MCHLIYFKCYLMYSVEGHLLANEANKWIKFVICPFLTVLALQVVQLLFDAGQLALQGLYSGPVLVLQLPQLLPVGLSLGLDLGGQVSLSLRQV